MTNTIAGLAIAGCMFLVNYIPVPWWVAAVAMLALGYALMRVVQKALHS